MLTLRDTGAGGGGGGILQCFLCTFSVSVKLLRNKIFIRKKVNRTKPNHLGQISKSRSEIFHSSFIIVC